MARRPRLRRRVMIRLTVRDLRELCRAAGDQPLATWMRAAARAAAREVHRATEDAQDRARQPGA
jgi:hypothetical protein